jgi:hypothetical protein
MKLHKQPIFFITTTNYSIGNINICTQSDRTFDIPFNQLATNKHMLDTFKLISTYADREKQKAIDFLVGYINAFEPRKGMREYLRTNPMLRILITDKDIQNNMQSIIDKHIILTQHDLHRYHKHTHFSDVDINMFNIDNSKINKAESIIYKHLIDNPDIPYISKILKERNRYNTHYYGGQSISREPTLLNLLDVEQPQFSPEEIERIYSLFE